MSNCQILNKTILKRFDVERQYYDNVIYDQQNNIIQRKYNGSDIKLVFNINVLDLCGESVTIGSFIRTAVRLLVKFDPSNILFIIDLRDCCAIIEELSTLSFSDSASQSTSSNTISATSTTSKKSKASSILGHTTNMVKLIDDLIATSTTAAVFTNVILLVSDCFKPILQKQFKELSKSCVSISTDIKSIGALKCRVPFTYNSLDAFINFNSQKQYIDLDFNELSFPINMAPMIQVLASYSVRYLEESKDRVFIVCVEKIPNIYRLYGLLQKYNLKDNSFVCLPEIDENKNRYISDICDQLGLKHFRKPSLATNFVSESKKNGKNIVAIDLHESAITMRHNDHINALNNSVIIFGFESSGIPADILTLATHFVQLEARSSINVIATVSIFFDALYPLI